MGAAALAPEGEDTTVPGLLSAALDAWITERGDTEQTFRLDPPPPERQAHLHGRLRRSLDAAGDDERHWGFRAIATPNAVAAQSRIKNACSAAGFGTNLNKRKLFLLRNGPWPSGAKTAALVADFEEAGGRTLTLSDDDLRTLSALRDLIVDNDPDLPGWLQARKPAHGLKFLRDALGDDAGPAASRDAGTEPVSEPEPGDEPDRYAAGPARGLRHRGAAWNRRRHGRTVERGPARTAQAHRDLRGIRFGQDRADPTARRGVRAARSVVDRVGPQQRPGAAGPAMAGNAQRLAGRRHVAGHRLPEQHRGGGLDTAALRGRPLSFQPLPDFASVVDDHDEFGEAVESAFAAMEPHAHISGKTPKANQTRAVLRETLQWYGRRPSPTLRGFLAALADLPDGVSVITERQGPGRGAGAESARGHGERSAVRRGRHPGRSRDSDDPVAGLPRPGLGDQHGRTPKRPAA